MFIEGFDFDAKSQPLLHVNYREVGFNNIPMWTLQLLQS